MRKRRQCTMRRTAPEKPIVCKGSKWRESSLRGENSLKGGNSLIVRGVIVLVFADCDFRTVFHLFGIAFWDIVSKFRIASCRMHEFVLSDYRRSS